MRRFWQHISKSNYFEISRVLLGQSGIWFDLYLELSKNKGNQDSKQNRWHCNHQGFKTIRNCFHIKTKYDLTQSLGKILKIEFTKANIPYVKDYKNQCFKNIRGCCLQEHNHEEANTVYMWHCFDIMKSSSFTEVFVEYNIFLIQVCHY